MPHFRIPVVIAAKIASPRTILSLAALLASIAVPAACRSYTTAVGGEVPTSLGEAFQARLRIAVAHSATDQLHRAFVRRRTIRLRGGGLRSLDRFGHAGEGQFLAADLLTPAVSLFDVDGRFVRLIGSKGQSPGHYQLPSGVGGLEGQRVAVLDFDPKRISVFDLAGGLIASMAYSMHAFSGQALAVAPDGVMSVFGVSSPGGRRGPDSRLVHQFTADGAHIRSVLTLPDDLPAWAWSYLDPFLSQSPRGLHVSLAPRYSPYVVRSDGTVESPALIAPPTFRNPAVAFDPRAVTPLPTGGPPTAEARRRFHLAYQDWRLSWTPVESVAGVGDVLLVQYQTLDPLRYTLDLWSLERGPVLLDQLHTNLRLLGVDGSGTCFFRENIDSKSSDEPTIVAATLRPRLRVSSRPESYATAP